MAQVEEVPKWQWRTDEAVREKKEELDLMDCEMGDGGAKYVSDAVLKNKEASVKMLSLGGNIIGNKGMEYLSEGLKENKTVEHLYLGLNEIGDEGIECLSDALKVNETVKSLSLNSNHIGDEGARFLSLLLKENETVEKLHLHVNNIGSAGMNFLLAAVQVNTSLTEVSHSYNVRASAESKQALQDALADMPARHAAREAYLSLKASRMVKSAAKR